MCRFSSIFLKTLNTDPSSLTNNISPSPLCSTVILTLWQDPIIDFSFRSLLFSLSSQLEYRMVSSFLLINTRPVLTWIKWFVFISKTHWISWISFLWWVVVVVVVLLLLLSSSSSTCNSSCSTTISTSSSSNSIFSNVLFTPILTIFF